MNITRIKTLSEATRRLIVVLLIIGAFGVLKGRHALVTITLYLLIAPIFASIVLYHKLQSKTVDQYQHK